MWLVLLDFSFLSHLRSLSMLLLRFTGGCCTACETAPSPCTTRLQALVRLRRSHITATFEFAAVISSTSVIDACVCTSHKFIKTNFGLATCLFKTPKTRQQHYMSCPTMKSLIVFLHTTLPKQPNLATTMHMAQPRKLLLSLCMHAINMMQHCLTACSMRASCKSRMMPAAEREHERTW